MSWLHRWLNPHCSHCMEIERERRVCLSCETLRTMLAEANYEKKQLLARVLNPSGPALKEEIDDLTKVPISSKNLPWPVMRARLEEQDRLKKLEMDRESVLKAEKLKELETLEKEVLGEVNHA